MKIKRAMVMLILVLAVLFTMSGCYGFNYNIEIYENGGSVTQSLLVSTEFGEQMQEQSLEDGAEGVQMEALELTTYELNGTELSQLALHTEYTDSFAALSERLNTLSVNESFFWLAEESSQEEVHALLKEAEEQEEPIAYILRDVCIETDKMGNSITITGFVIDYKAEDTLITEDTGLICTMDLKFPGTITEHTVGKKIDDTTLQINLNELWAGESDIAFTIRAELPGSNEWLVIVLALCAIGGIGGFVLYRKRRSSVQPQEAPETDSGEAEPQDNMGEASEEKTVESCENS